MTTGSQEHTRPVRVGPVTLGGGHFAVIAGPCAIESTEQLQATVQAVRAAGAVMARGGIFKLRTDPASFQGLEERGLAELARAELDLPLVSEVTDPRYLEAMDPLVAMYQVGSRNMYNYALLKELGRTRKPILLKRGFAARIDEWLLAADYLHRGGNEAVVLCERGIRTFEEATRNTLDLGAVAYLKEHYPYPVVVDPSHGTGKRELVTTMALAAAAAGADGLLVEVHPRPDQALSDGRQSLDPAAFAALMGRLRRVLAALDRTLHELP
jgi:3-deoxy-7-phosphoheptulonate synthase